MKASRDSKGRFVKGHTGFKPAGAISKKNRHDNTAEGQIILKFFNEIRHIVSPLAPAQRTIIYFRLLKYLQ